MQNLETLAELAKALPAQYQEAAINLVERMGEVIEGIGDKPIEWRPSTLKLVQGTSDRSKLPKGATIGSFVLGEDLVNQPLEVIPISTHDSRQYWDPNPDNAKMLCNSPDALTGFQYGKCRECPYSKFDEELNKSMCNKAITVLSITSDLSTIFINNFAKTNYAGGSDWKMLMRKAGVDPYKRKYNLAAQTSTKSKNVELLKVEPVSPPNNRVDPELYPFLKELFRISQADRKMHLEKFYEYVNNKGASGVAGLVEAPGQVVELLSSPEEVVVPESDVTDVVEVGEVSDKSTKAKKYTL